MAAEQIDMLELPIGENNTKFRQKMLRFYDLSMYTGLKAEDFSWPLLQGKIQRRLLCGPTFVDDKKSSPDDWSPEYLLDIVKARVFSCGGGFLKDRGAGIALLLLKRTMKFITMHLNFMFQSAARKDRPGPVLITAEEVEELMQRNPFRFFQYFNHFLPNPQPDAAYNNRFSRSLHNKYFGSADGKDLYESKKFWKIQKFRADTCIKNVQKFYPVTMIQEAIDMKNNSFVKPNKDYSTFHAKLFHTACGLPPLDTELIAVIDFIAVSYIDQLVYETIVYHAWHDYRNIPYLDDYYRYMTIFPHDVLFYFQCPGCLPLPDSLLRPSLTFPPQVDPYYDHRHTERKERKRKAIMQQMWDDFNERKRMRNVSPPLQSFTLSGYARERHI